MSRNPLCKNCSLHASAKTVCLWGTGKGEAFIITEAPRKPEDVRGLPFQGESGILMRRILNDYGIGDAYVTHVVKCKTPGDRKPEPGEISACRPYVQEEIEKRKPRSILLVGAIAMKAMIGRTSITEMNGQIVEKNGQRYVCAFSPGYALRDPSKHEPLRVAVARYVESLQGDFKQELPDWAVIDRSSLRRFLDDWHSCFRFSFDCETTGLDWWSDTFEINTIAFTLVLPNEKKVVWALPLAKSPVLPPAERQLLIDYLIKSSKDKECIGHNGKYDNLCLLSRYDNRFFITGDSSLAHHLVDENTSHELKVVARQYMNAPDYDIPLKEKLGNVKIKKLLEYNGADTYYTEGCEAKFVRMMDEQEQWLYHKVIIPASRVLEKAEHNGLFVDITKIDKTEAEESRKLLKIEAELNDIAGGKVNWNSPAQVAKVLYGKLGLEPLIYTDGGSPSTSEAALVGIRHPIAKKLEEYRSHKKFLSTYIGERQKDGSYAGGWRSFMSGPHLYLGIKMPGTVTGRYSSRLHQVPRDGTVRNIVTAPKGWTFVQLDLSQAELRVIAIVAKEPEMLKCFKNNIDIHWRTLMDAIETGRGEYVKELISTAQEVTGNRRKLSFTEAIKVVRNITPDHAIEIWKGWKEARKKAKGINFGFPYGQSAEGFIDYAKLKYGFEPTLQESTQFRDTFFNTYHFLPAWHERQKSLVHTDGFVRNLAGRKRRLPGIWSKDKSVIAEAERQAINAPIQGFIGDYKAMIMVELGEAFDWEYYRIVGEVHDSILQIIRDDHLEDVLPELKKRAENPRLAKECGLNFPIKMAVDIELGPWGAGKGWKG